MKKTAIIIAIMALIFQSCSFSPNPDDSGMQEGADNADVTMLRIANADGPAILFRPDTGEYLQYILLEGGIPKPVVLSDNDGNTYMFSLCNLASLYGTRSIHGAHEVSGNLRAFKGNYEIEYENTGVFLPDGEEAKVIKDIHFEDSALRDEMTTYFILDETGMMRLTDIEGYDKSYYSVDTGSYLLYWEQLINDYASSGTMIRWDDWENADPMELDINDPGAISSCSDNYFWDSGSGDIVSLRTGRRMDFSTSQNTFRIEELGIEIKDHEDHYSEGYTILKLRPIVLNSSVHIPVFVSDESNSSFILLNYAIGDSDVHVNESKPYTFRSLDFFPESVYIGEYPIAERRTGEICEVIMAAGTSAVFMAISSDTGAVESIEELTWNERYPDAVCNYATITSDHIILELCPMDSGIDYLVINRSNGRKQYMQDSYDGSGELFLYSASVSADGRYILGSPQEDFTPLYDAETGILMEINSGIGSECIFLSV